MTSPRCRPSAPSRAARSARARRLAGNRRPSGAGIRASAALVLAGLALWGCGEEGGESESGADRFDADRAFELISDQVAVGQRPAGSAQLRELAETLRTELPNGRFEPVPSSGPQQGLRNVVGLIPGTAPGPAILVGAHYDTEYHPKGFVGANDSAAGTAAVVELARQLEEELPEEHREVRFVLFDGEEEPPGCPDARFEACALRGSRAYVAAHPGEVGELILLDYVANRGLRLPREGNSDPALWEKLRAAAETVGAAEFFPAGDGPPIIDDHIPFILQGIPSIDLIDFSYRHADTVEDTPDKLDPAALDAVGETTAELVVALASE